MLLRSSSTPSLTSWFQQQNPDSIPRNLKPPTLSFHPSTPSNDPPKKLSRPSSETDLLSLSRSLLNNPNFPLSSVSMEEEEEEDNDNEIETKCLLVDGIGGGNGGRKIFYGGDNEDYDHGNDGVDVYYNNLIESNPGNAMILGNYAKYLKEVCGDVVKAEEYCSRAILANPGDGTALSMYAGLIWETQRDAFRAQGYFDQAVEASPDDSYVMAAYARFLWDADEEVLDTNEPEPRLSHEASQQFPVAAAS